VMYGDGNFFNTRPSVLELGNFIEQKVCVLCVTCTPYNYKVPQSVIYDLHVYMYDLYMYTHVCEKKHKKRKMSISCTKL